MHGQIPPYQYCSIISQFQSFCDYENIPPQLRIPASKHLLCAFAASRVGALAGNTVQIHLATIKAWHIYNNKPWHGGPCLCYILNGIANLAPSSSKKPPRPPITHSMLLLLANSLSITDSFDTCFAMWSQSRLREILSEWETSFKPAFVIYRCHLLSPFNQNGSCKCHLPFTQKKLLAHCNSIWLPARIPAITGHSFCIGGTTELLLARVPPDIVKALGRWFSDAFLCYWHSLELLAPLHMENLPRSALP
ncbi:hypothetical protein BS17DRAFT_845931 [Gyrodon lividus]|nr:hypothetical protein BS17DRAFT_845931 [Gyrodon lividus]